MGSSKAAALDCGVEAALIYKRQVSALNKSAQLYCCTGADSSIRLYSGAMLPLRF